MDPDPAGGDFDARRFSDGEGVAVDEGLAALFRAADFLQDEVFSAGLSNFRELAGSLRVGVLLCHHPGGRSLGRRVDKFLQFGQEHFGSALSVAQPAEAAALAVQNKQRRETLDLELFGQLLVGLLQGGGLRLALGEIDRHQHQVGPGVGLKLGLEEDLFAKLHAPAAPVRAAEVDEHEFAFRFRLSLSAGQIIQPGGRSVRRAIEKRATYEPDQQEPLEGLF